MTAAITAGTGATPSALLHDGAQVVKFDATGISTGAGKRLAQIQTFTTGAVATGTTAIPLDNTIPQNTEGDQYMSLAFTPTNVNSLIEIDVVLNAASSAAGQMIAALFQDSTANSVAASISGVFGINQPTSVSFKYCYTAGSLTATTFKVRAGNAQAGTTTFNGGSGAQFLGGVMASRITIKEYLP